MRRGIEQDNTSSSQFNIGLSTEAEPSQILTPPPPTPTPPTPSHSPPGHCSPPHIASKTSDLFSTGNAPSSSTDTKKKQLKMLSVCNDKTWIEDRQNPDPYDDLFGGRENFPDWDCQLRSGWSVSVPEPVLSVSNRKQHSLSPALVIRNQSSSSVSGAKSSTYSSCAYSRESMKNRTDLLPNTSALSTGEIDVKNKSGELCKPDRVYVEPDEITPNIERVLEGLGEIVSDAQYITSQPQVNVFKPSPSVTAFNQLSEVLSQHRVSPSRPSTILYGCKEQLSEQSLSQSEPFMKNNKSLSIQSGRVNVSLSNWKRKSHITSYTDSFSPTLTKRCSNQQALGKRFPQRQSCVRSEERNRQSLTESYTVCPERQIQARGSFSHTQSKRTYESSNWSDQSKSRSHLSGSDTDTSSSACVDNIANKTIAQDYSVFDATERNLSHREGEYPANLSKGKQQPPFCDQSNSPLYRTHSSDFARPKQSYKGTFSNRSISEDRSNQFKGPDYPINSKIRKFSSGYNESCDLSSGSDINETPVHDMGLLNLEQYRKNISFQSENQTLNSFKLLTEELDKSSHMMVQNEMKTYALLGEESTPTSDNRIHPASMPQSSGTQYLQPGRPSHSIINYVGSPGQHGHSPEISAVDLSPSPPVLDSRLLAMNSGSPVISRANNKLYPHQAVSQRVMHSQSPSHAHQMQDGYSIRRSYEPQTSGLFDTREMGSRNISMHTSPNPAMYSPQSSQQMYPLMVKRDPEIYSHLQHEMMDGRSIPHYSGLHGGMGQRELTGTYLKPPPVDLDELSEEERERMKIKRERNRVAAAKCRNRRRELLERLEKEAEQLEREREILRESVRRLQMQKRELGSLLDNHESSCDKNIQTPSKESSSGENNSGVQTKSDAEVHKSPQVMMS